MEAWGMYEKLQSPLSNVNRSGGDTTLLYTSLHHLIQLLSSTTPRSRVIGFRIVSVLSTLRRVGGRVRKWQLQLLRAIVKEHNFRPQNLEHLKDLIVDILPPPVYPNTPISKITPPTSAPRWEDTFPQNLSEIDVSEESQSPMLVAPISATFPHDQERGRLLNVIGETQSFDKAWDAYRAFSSYPLAEDPVLNTYPSRHLHRLVSLLATVKPRTQKVYLSLVSIISTLRASGHLVYTWEWNFLMDASAKGWRKTRFEDYKASLQVFNDMLAYQKQVRESICPPQNVRANSHEGSIPIHDNLAPDVYSYTTLISHAARTLSPQALEHARSLLDSAGIIPNRVTLLAQLHLHTYHNQMYGFRRTVAEIRDRGFTLDIYGVNSIIWAFARNEHLQVAEAIYRVLRNNANPDEAGESMFEGVDEGIDAMVKFLDEVENIVIPPKVVPNGITYTILIQSYAYQGDLTRSLQVLAEMLSSPDPVATWKGGVGSMARFPPVMQIFRALFLGFYRHGVGPVGSAAHRCGHRRSRGNNEPGLEWNLDNLYTIYKGFLEQPAHRKPEDTVVYWLIKAFEKCGGGDYWRMREVWTTLESRWGKQWGSRLRRVRKTIYQNTEHAEVTSTSGGEGVCREG
jgi:pentatricopeptide repeat protein